MPEYTQINKLQIDGKLIETANFVRWLGININKNLTFDIYIPNLRNKESMQLKTD